MLATEALKNGKESQKLDEHPREKIASIQIVYIKQKIRHYTNEGFVKCYEIFPYILPEVIEYFEQNGYGLCNGKISWKNATFGEALHNNGIANRMFLKKVAEEINYTLKSGYTTTYKFPLRHIHCKNAINTLKDLGYEVIQDGRQLVLSVKDAKESVLKGHIINLPYAIEVKESCYRAQKRIINDLIEVNVQLGFNKAVIPLKYEIGEFLPEVFEYYLSKGFDIKQDTISWNHLNNAEELAYPLLNSIYSKVKRYSTLNSVAIVLKQTITDEVMQKLLLAGYNLYVFSDSTIISWENDNLISGGEKIVSNEELNIEGLPQSLASSILLQIEDEISSY